MDLSGSFLRQPRSSSITKILVTSAAASTSASTIPSSLPENCQTTLWVSVPIFPLSLSALPLFLPTIPFNLRLRNSDLPSVLRPEPMSIERFGANKPCSFRSECGRLKPIPSILGCPHQKGERSIDAIGRCVQIAHYTCIGPIADSLNLFPCRGKSDKKLLPKPVVQGGAPTSYPTPSSPATSPMQQHASQFQNPFLFSK